MKRYFDSPDTGKDTIPHRKDDADRCCTVQGAFGTIFNLVLFFTLLFLLKLSLRGTEEGRFLKKQFAFGLGWLFNVLFVIADIGLASALRPEAHANGAVGGTCALAVVSG